MPGGLRPAVDLNPDPRILELELTAKKAVVDVTGSGLEANAFTFNGTIPGPELRAKVGDTVVVHFRNELPEPTVVHWHGIELDNANDGTTVTQDLVPTGGTFTYRFRADRYFFHIHIRRMKQIPPVRNRNDGQCIPHAIGYNVCTFQWIYGYIYFGSVSCA